MMSEDRLVIESVTGADIDLPVAGPGGRSYAFIIDWHIKLLLAFVWLLMVPLLMQGTLSIDALSKIDSTPLLVVIYIPAAVIFFLYHPILEIVTRGSTPGKKMVGIRIVTREGGIPTTTALLIRNVFRLVDSLPAMYLVGLTTTVFTRYSVRIGDLAAGTVLVYQPKQGDASFENLEKLHQKAANPDRIELIQDILLRWNGLDSPARRAFGARLLADEGIQTLPEEDDDLREALRKLLD